MAGKGHEERFPSPSLSGRCRLGEATFAGMGGKEEDAPISDFPALIPERGGSTHSRPSPEERYVGDVAPKAARRP